MTLWKRTNFALAIILLNAGTISWRQEDIFHISKFIVLGTNTDRHSQPRIKMVSLLQVAAVLISSARVYKVAPICCRNKYSPCQKSRDLIVALIRSTRGDTKITLPPIHTLHELSPNLASLYNHPHVSTGQLPVLRGEYTVWDEIFETISEGCISKIAVSEMCVNNSDTLWDQSASTCAFLEYIWGVF